ncbi:hypothetical protein Leryth_011505 [Lithospermum erythrorhizon]|nr:hypothetical protein Leryth_011505 [Lithospermum erythrorhizon]
MATITMKYQLPNEELDSLISVTTDEDLENMIEEHDRIMSTAPVKPARIRLFLFLVKPETTTSMGALLNDAKSETWFVDALNNSDLLNRGASDSAVIDNLLDFDGMVKNDSSTNLEGSNQEISIADQEVHTTQHSLVVETSSSFDSGLSSPTIENLPPIKVRVNKYTQGLDEQFSQMSVATYGVNNTVVPRDNAGRAISDDDGLDKAQPVALRKPPLPLQTVQRKFTDPYCMPSQDSKQAGAYNLQSPDSVTSDNSVTSAASINKHLDLQDPSIVANPDNRVFTQATDPRNNITNPSSQIHFQQVQEPAALPSSLQNLQQQQHQFIQAPLQYIHQHPGTGFMQVSSYYPKYASAPTTQQTFHQQQSDQQYPVYLMPVNHAQQYNLNQQSHEARDFVASSARPPNQDTIPEANAEVLRTVQEPTPTYHQVPHAQFQQQYYDFSKVHPQTQTMATATDAEVHRTVQGPGYVQKVAQNHFHQQYYDGSHVRPQTQTISTETDAEVRRTVQVPQLTYVQVQPDQFQQQYYGISHVHPHTQTITTGQAATANYGYNYTYPPHDQLNYVQHPTQITSQYQTITPATALLISQATSQLAADNASQQIQNYDICMERLFV